MHFELYQKLKQYAAMYPERVKSLTRRELENIEIQEKEENDDVHNLSRRDNLSSGYGILVRH